MSRCNKRDKQLHLIHANKACLTTQALYSLKNLHVEGVLQVAQKFSNHLLAEALPGDEEVRHALRCRLHKVMIDEEVQAFLGFSVEKYKTSITT